MSLDLEKVTTLKAEIEALRERLLEATKEILRDGVPEIFAEYGDILHSFGWVQYAPSFNDGDPCYFSKNGMFIIAKEDFDKAIEDAHLDLSTADEWDIESALREVFEEGAPSPAFSPYRGKVVEIDRQDRPNPNFDPRYKEALEAADAIYCAIDEDIANTLFGESSKVVISADGVEVEDYEQHY